MTNTLALWLFAIIVAAIGWDYWQNDLGVVVFLGRKGLDLLQWIAFWR